MQSTRGQTKEGKPPVGIVHRVQSTGVQNERWQSIRGKCTCGQNTTCATRWCAMYQGPFFQYETNLQYFDNLELSAGNILRHSPPKELGIRYLQK